MAVLGVDGWRGQWVGARLDGRRATLTVLADAAAVLAEPDVEVVAIDMPIGLSDDGPRACDLAARTLLGRAGSSVFPAPLRPVLRCTSYEEACAVSRFQASAARMPGTLLAAICSPLPDPPRTTPSEPGSATTRSPTSKQNGG